jgi:carbamoyl-phosphate synthase large subunit
MLLNILVTAASRRVGLVRAFRNALDAMRVRGSIIGTDISPLSPAIHFCDRAYRVPLSSDPGYLDAIAGLCDGENVGLVVPTIDEELPLFGGAVARFAAHGVRVAVSPEETSRICNDKFDTCVRLRQGGVESAASYLPGTVPPSATLPMFVKPRGGRGSIGAFVARTPDELAFFTRYVDDPVIQDYLVGPEFTIDLSAASSTTLQPRWLDPRTGTYSTADTITGGNRAERFLAPFAGDAVLYLVHD